MSDELTLIKVTSCMCQCDECIYNNDSRVKEIRKRNNIPQVLPIKLNGVYMAYLTEYNYYRITLVNHVAVVYCKSVRLVNKKNMIAKLNEIKI